MTSAATDSPKHAPTHEQMHLYKSEEGFERIMSWYDAVVAKITVPVESVWLDTRFGRTHALAAGRRDAEPLLLIPGVAGSAPLFRRAIEPLSRHFRVYAVDIPGQPGRSDPNPVSLLDDSHVRWVCDLLDSLGLQSAHIGGQSAGGGIAMQVGVEAPHRTRSVIMFGPTGLARARLPVKIWLTKVMTKRSADALEEDLTAKSIRPDRTGESFGTYDRELARSMALCTRYFRVDRAVGVYNEVSGRVDFLKGLRVLKKFFLAEKKSWQSQLKVPALLVFGEHELSLNPYKVAEKAKRTIPHLETAVLKHAGHGAIFDQPEKVAEMMREFVFDRVLIKHSQPQEEVLGGKAL